MIRTDPLSHVMIQTPLVATRGTCDRLAVGAVLVANNASAVSGYNGAPCNHRHCDEYACLGCEESFSRDTWAKNEAGVWVCPTCKETGAPERHHMHRVYGPDGAEISRHCKLTVHAELNAILNAAQEGVSTRGATLFCTDSPCWECAKAIINAKIKRVVFQRLYQRREPLWLLARHVELIQWRPLGPFTHERFRTRQIQMPRKPQGAYAVSVRDVLHDPAWGPPPVWKPHASENTLTYVDNIPYDEDGTVDLDRTLLKGSYYAGSVKPFNLYDLPMVGRPDYYASREQRGITFQARTPITVSFQADGVTPEIWQTVGYNRFLP